MTLKKFNFAAVVYTSIEIKTNKGQDHAEKVARSYAWNDLNKAIINNTDFKVKDIEIEEA